MTQQETRPAVKIISLLFIGGLFALLVMSLVRPLLLLPSNYLIWSNEGWNAGHVARFVADGTLYPPPESLATNNYPPLSFLLMAPFGAAGIDLIYAGRGMALLAWLGTALLIFMCSLRLGANKWGAGLGTLVFMATIARFFPYYIGMYEPQWLAHTIMLLGLYMFLGNRNGPALPIAIVLMVLAGLTKHNIIAVPLACFAWLFLYERKLFLKAFLTAIGAGAATVLAVHISFGADFWFNLFNARVLSLFHFSRKAEHILSVIIPLLAWLVFAIRNKTEGRGKESALIHLLIGASLLEFLAFASGVGVAANVVFDLIIAISIGIGFYASTLLKGRITPAFAVLAALLFIQIAAWPTMKYLAIAYDAKARETLFNRSAAISKTIEALRAIDGPAWCEQPAICYWAGKPYTYDDFNTEMRLATGRISLADMQVQMNKLGIKALQIDDPKTVSTEPATYGESTLAPLLPSFAKKIVPENGHGVIWARE